MNMMMMMMMMIMMMIQYANNAKDIESVITRMAALRKKVTPDINRCTVWRKKNACFSNNCNSVYFQYKKVMLTPKQPVINAV
jgi:hypothetical protein